MKIAPDWEITNIELMIFVDDEIWFMVMSTGTITVEADIGNYLEFDRIPTNERFNFHITLIITVVNDKVSLIKVHFDFINIFLKMNVVQLVSETDKVTDYLKKIMEEGLLANK